MQIMDTSLYLCATVLLLCVHLSGARPGASDDQSKLSPGQLPSNGLLMSASDYQELHDWEEDTRYMSQDEHMEDQSKSTLEDKTPAPKHQYQADINLVRKSRTEASCIENRYYSYEPCLGYSITTFTCRKTSHTACNHQINKCGMKSCEPITEHFSGCNGVYVTGCRCGCSL